MDKNVEKLLNEYSDIHKIPKIHNYILDTDKIETLDDIKKVLKFLCLVSIKPLPVALEYGGFSEVEQYFE